MRLCFSDLETFSTVPIAGGAHRYAEGAEIMIWSYAFDDGSVTVWDLTSGAPMPDDLAEALADPDTVFVWHQAAFDMTVIRRCMPEADIPPSRIICSMALALAHALPGSLDKLCTILKVSDDKAKMKEGRALIRKFCIPQNKRSAIRRRTRETDPEDWATFLRYAAQDIEAQRAAYRKIPKWNYPALPFERHLFRLDQAINARGVAVDLDLAHAAIASADRLKKDMAEQVKDITFGLVGAATQRDAMLKHLLEGYGFALPDLRTSTVEVILDDKDIDLPDPVRELLEIRVSASRNSTAKYKALLRSVSSDGRLRGTLQFCGASRTSRWSAKLMQLHNLSRVPKYLKPQYDYAIQSVKEDAVDLVFDNPMEVLGSVVRGALVAKPGHKLVVADLSNIEGRALAWAAGEAWKIKAFEDFDNGIGEDIYKLAYARAFNVSVATVDSEQRQLGKILELAMGYGGGVGAFITFALTYGVDLEAMAKAAFPTLPRWAVVEAKSAWCWAVEQKRTYGLGELVYVVCDALKRMWRRAHPATVQWWSDVAEAAVLAILNEGETFHAGTVSFVKQKAWLRMIMPSGSCLCYPSPKVTSDKTFKYMGTNQFTKQWGYIATYAGKVVENAIQKIARDVLAEGLMRVADELWPIVLHVHDEIVAETPDTDDWTHQELSRLLATNPRWAKGLPLAAAGAEMYSYRKE